MKKHFNKELVMTKEDNEDFKNSIKCWVCANDMLIMMLTKKPLSYLCKNIEAP